MPTLGYLSMKKVPIITEEWEGYLLAFVIAIAITVTIVLLTNSEK